jgi:hypothetical protein
MMSKIQKFFEWTIHNISTGCPGFSLAKAVLKVAIIAVCTLAMVLTFSVVKPVVHNGSLPQAQAVEVDSNLSSLSNEKQCDAFVAKNPDVVSQLQNIRVDDGYTLVIKNRAICDQYHNTVLADVLKERPVYNNLMKDSGVEKVTGFVVKNKNTGTMMDKVYLNYCHNESLVSDGCNFQQVELESASWYRKNAGASVSSGDLRQYGVQEGDWVQLEVKMVEVGSRKTDIFQYGYYIKPQELHDKDGNLIATGLNEIDTKVKAIDVTGSVAGLGGLEVNDHFSITVGFPLLYTALCNNNDIAYNCITVTDVVTYEDLIHVQSGYTASSAQDLVEGIIAIALGIIVAIMGVAIIVISEGTLAGLGQTLVFAGIGLVAGGIFRLCKQFIAWNNEMKILILSRCISREVFAPYIRPNDPYIVESYISKLHDVSQIVSLVLHCSKMSYDPTCYYYQDALNQYGLDARDSAAIFEFGITEASIAEKLRSNTVLTADEITLGIKATDAGFANLQIVFMQLSTTSVKGYISCDTLYAICMLINTSTTILDFDIDDARVSPTVQGKWHYRLKGGAVHVLEGFAYTGNEPFAFEVNARTATSPYTAYGCPDGTTLHTVDTGNPNIDNVCVSNQYGMPPIPAIPYTEYVYGKYQAIDIIKFDPTS